MADKSYWVALRLKRKSLGLCLACGYDKSNPKHIAHLRKQAARAKRRPRRVSEKERAVRLALNKRQAKANREWLQDYRRKVGCMKCGEDHLACLEFHHRDQATKAFHIAGSCYLSRARLEAEVAKCDVLCANCHRKEHWSQRTGQWAKTKG